jgi:hypothetical protein
VEQRRKRRLPPLFFFEAAAIWGGEAALYFQLLFFAGADGLKLDFPGSREVSVIVERERHKLSSAARMASLALDRVQSCRADSPAMY